jgi:hypothetical protein
VLVTKVAWCLVIDSCAHVGAGVRAARDPTCLARCVVRVVEPIIASAPDSYALPKVFAWIRASLIKAGLRAIVCARSEGTHWLPVM